MVSLGPVTSSRNTGPDPPKPPQGGFFTPSRGQAGASTGRARRHCLAARSRVNPDEAARKTARKRKPFIKKAMIKDHRIEIKCRQGKKRKRHYTCT